jgi:hypothetical protein
MPKDEMIHPVDPQHGLNTDPLGEENSFPDGTAMRIQGDPDVISEITELIKDSNAVKFIRVEQDDSGGVGADFILETIATVIAIASSLFFDEPIVPKLWEILHRHKGTKITVETPTQTLTIESSGDLSIESLQTALSALLQN